MKKILLYALLLLPTFAVAMDNQQQGAGGGSVQEVFDIDDLRSEVYEFVGVIEDLKERDCLKTSDPFVLQSDHLFNVAVNRDGTRIFCSSHGEYFVFDTVRKVKIYSKNSMLASDAISLSKDGNYAAYVDSNHICILNLTTRAVQRIHIHGPSPVRCLSLDDQAQKVAVLFVDGRCCVYDVATRAWALLAGPAEHRNSIAIDSAGLKVVFGNENIVCVYDFENAQLHAYAGHTGAVNSVSISDDGTIVASGSEDRTVKVWNIVHGQCLHNINAHNAAVNRVALSGDGLTLSSSSSNHDIKTWDVQEGRCLKTFQVANVASSPIALSYSGLDLACRQNARECDITSSRNLPDNALYLLGKIYHCTHVGFSTNHLYSYGLTDSEQRIFDVLPLAVKRMFRKCDDGNIVLFTREQLNAVHAALPNTENQAEDLS